VNIQKTEFRHKGRSFLVPMFRLDGWEVIIPGRWLRIAILKDEDWIDGEPAAEPEKFIDALRKSGLHADVFAFSGPIDGRPVAIDGKAEVDNVAAVRTDEYKAWWDGLPQEARKNTRRAAKRGVETRVANLDDGFVAGIKAIYDETPVRQGRRFWHYGKDLETIKRENSTYLDRSEVLGAYYSGQLIGFIKIVYVGHTARIMQILCLNSHQDKRPMIALIVKAAEICHGKGIKYLVYGKFTYGSKSDSSITEFKRRLGFEQVDFPRYYIPLSLRGRIALKLGAHKGWLELLPQPLVNRLLKMRSWWLQRKERRDSVSIPGKSRGL
jgi:hypothetical protein